MTLTIELKDDQIVKLKIGKTGKTGKTLQIIYKSDGGDRTAVIPLRIVQAFGELTTPSKLLADIEKSPDDNPDPE